LARGGAGGAPLAGVGPKVVHALHAVVARVRHEKGTCSIRSHTARRVELTVAAARAADDKPGVPRECLHAVVGRVGGNDERAVRRHGARLAKLADARTNNVPVERDSAEATARNMSKRS
jgi:hypothetical protein